jgi:hypothetical protein
MSRFSDKSGRHSTIGQTITDANKTSTPGGLTSQFGQTNHKNENHPSVAKNVQSQSTFGKAGKKLNLNKNDGVSSENN